MTYNSNVISEKHNFTHMWGIQQWTSEKHGAEQWVAKSQEEVGFGRNESKMSYQIGRVSSGILLPRGLFQSEEYCVVSFKLPGKDDFEYFHNEETVSARDRAESKCLVTGSAG